MSNGAGRAVRISNVGASLGAANATTVTLLCNSIQNYANNGLEVDAGQYTGTLIAENNWWNSATGPTNANNPGGAGEEVVAPDNNVDFVPFQLTGTDGDPGTPGFQCSCLITACPVNITKSNDPNQCGATVTYPAATTNSFCGAVSYSKPSGSFFNVGVTTVTVTTAGMTPGNQATCQFTVTVNDTQAPTQPLRVWTQDENRFGLITVWRRRLTLRGVKPCAPYQHERQSFLLYGNVEPLTGESFFLEPPGLDTPLFQLFLNHFAQEGVALWLTFVACGCQRNERRRLIR